MIEQRKEYDIITGYSVTLSNGTHSFDKKASSESSFVTMNDLLLNTNYTVSVAALSGKTKGRSSEWISFVKVGKFLHSSPRSILYQKRRSELLMSPIFNLPQ